MTNFSPFEFVKDINFEKNYLMNDEYAENIYNAWVINRALSLSIDTIGFANEMNCNYHLSNKLQHDFLFYSIRKKKRFVKWPWKKGIGDDISLIMETYKYSRKKAKEALAVLTPSQLEYIRKQQKEKEGGIEND